MRFARYRLGNAREEVRNTDLLDIYILNLVVTLGMFLVLIFRAWLELRNYKLMWKELEYRHVFQTMGRLLKAEKDLFSKVEGGEDLYNMLTELFKE